MLVARPHKLDPPVDIARDHILGNPEAEITLVEYGSYACPFDVWPVSREALRRDDDVLRTRV